MVRLKPMEVGGPYTMTISWEYSVTKLRRNRGVAVGLIDVSVGGTPQS